MPKRIQRKHGEKLPPNCVYVGRGSRWSNPYRVGTFLSSRELMSVTVPRLGHGKFTIATPEIALQLWRTFVKPPDDFIIAELRGKDVACWCSLDVPCHGDDLVAIANRPRKGDEIDLLEIE